MAKAKAKVKKKPKPKVKLSKAEEFYINSNLNKTDVELAKDLGKPLPVVVEHLHKTQSGSRIAKLLIHEKGCTIMTEGASMAADESRKGYVSEQAIREAVNRGDYEEAARLQAIIKSQRQVTNEDTTAKYIHFTK